MAAGYLPAPGAVNHRGEEIGPCVDPCEHIDCAATRRDAEAHCRICSEPIGYDRGFFQEWDRPHQPGQSTLVHSSCLLKEVNQ